MRLIHSPRRLSRIALAMVAGLMLARTVYAGEPTPGAAGEAPAPASDEEFDLEIDGPAGFPDPWEGANRGILRFNRELNRWVINPVTRTYRFLVPDLARLAIRRAFVNLNSPAVLINDLLQREWGDAAVTVERFAVNSTIGLGGLFDPATHIGLARHHSDFGQTLALAGVDSGPYLILPVFGPTTARDAVGDVVDFCFEPVLYFLPFTQLFIYQGSSGLTARDAYHEAMEALDTSSIDYYAALHNAYYQNRVAEIWNRRGHHRPAHEEPAASLSLEN